MNQEPTKNIFPEEQKEAPLASFNSPITEELKQSPPPLSTETEVIPPSFDYASFGSNEGGSASQNPPIQDRGIKKILLAGVVVIFLFFLGFFITKFLPKLKVSQITLNYWGLWEPENVMQTVIADFEKNHPKIKINYVRQSPKQYRERLASSLARGEGPDIFRFHNTWLPMFTKELAPLSQKIANEINFSQSFYPVVEKDLKRGGQYFGIPLEIDGLGLFVNEEIFRAAGIAYPQTWEEFETAARKLTVYDHTGRIVTAGAALGVTSNIEHWSDILGLMMLQNGVDLTNPTGKLAEDALSYFKSFATPPNNTWNETLDNSILAFAKGQVAMIFAPSWQVFEIKNINPNLSFKVLPVPQLPGVNISWASYWVEGVWTKSKYQEEAFEFLKYLVSKEVMVKLYSEESKIRLFGEPYSRVDLGETIKGDPFVGAFISQAPYAKSFYLCSRTQDNGINDKIIKYFEDAVNSLDQGISPATALETAAKGVNQILSTYGLVSSVSATQ